VGRRLEFQKAARNGDGTFDIPGTHFLFLAHVEHNKIGAPRAASRHVVDTDLRDGPARRVEKIMGGVGHTLLLSCALLPESRAARARGRTSRQRSQTLETPAVSCAIPRVLRY